MDLSLVLLLPSKLENRNQKQSCGSQNQKILFFQNLLLHHHSFQMNCPCYDTSILYYFLHLYIFIYKNTNEENFNTVYKLIRTHISNRLDYTRNNPQTNASYGYGINPMGIGFMNKINKLILPSNVDQKAIIEAINVGRISDNNIANEYKTSLKNLMSEQQLYMKQVDFTNEINQIFKTTGGTYFTIPLSISEGIENNASSSRE